MGDNRPKKPEIEEEGNCLTQKAEKDREDREMQARNRWIKGMGESKEERGAIRQKFEVSQALANEVDESEQGDIREVGEEEKKESAEEINQVTHRGTYEIQAARKEDRREERKILPLRC